MNESTSTIVATFNNGETSTFENARITGIVGGYVCIQTAVESAPKTAPWGGTGVTVTTQNIYVVAADVASIILSNASGDGEDTHEVVGQDFNSNMTALVMA